MPAHASAANTSAAARSATGATTSRPARAAVVDAPPKPAVSLAQAACALAAAASLAIGGNAAAVPPAWAATDATTTTPQGAALTAAREAAAAGATVKRRAPFLSSNGAKGLLAEEETRLYELRLKAEGEVAAELDRARLGLEDEAKASPGASIKLCATPFGIDVVGITELVALTGALVGGFSARARKAEVERLNDQLRKINLSLRQQARAGTVYAPGLTYAPQPLAPGGLGGGGGNGSAATAVAASAVAAPAATTVVVAPPPPPPQPVVEEAAPSSSSAAGISIVSLDEEEMSPEMKQCVHSLREGKRLLKAKDGGPAMVRFEKALMLAEAMGDTLHEKRAVRGLAAAARLLGERRAAIGHLERVLAISRATGDYVGDADACGTIADLYTELGAFEKAAEYYDRYISRMATDGPV